jgi:hypothetical protein
VLHNLQQQFKKSVLEGNKNLESLVLNQNDLSAGERIDIYRNNTFVSLKNALLEIFPVVAEVTSLEYFRFVAHEFIQKNPPKQGALLGYGEDFPKFLEAHASAQSFSFLEDLATLEWLMHQSFYSQDEALLKTSDMRAEDLNDIDHLRFKGAAHVFLLSSEYTICSLYSLVQNKDDVQSLNIHVAECALVYRDEALDVQMMPISKPTYDTLSKLFLGEKLVDVINFLTEKYGENFAIQSDLALCFEQGLFVK